MATITTEKNTDPSATGGMDTTDSSSAPLAGDNPTAVPPDGNDNEGADTNPSVDITVAPPQPPTKKKESPGCLTLLVGTSSVALLVVLVLAELAHCGAELVTTEANSYLDCSNAVAFTANVGGEERPFGAVSFNGGASALYIEGMTVANNRCFVGSHKVTASDLGECASVMMALTPDANGFTPFVEIDGRTVTCNVGSGKVEDCFPKQ